MSYFFRDVLGVRTTTYDWGFRGADPVDFYAYHEGYGIHALHAIVGDIISVN